MHDQLAGKNQTPGAAHLSGGAGLAHYGAGAAHLHAGRADRHGGHQRGRVYRGHKTLPVRVVRVPVAYATGSEDVDALLNGVTANLDALHKLNDEIPDKQLSDAMDRMEKAGRSIADTVAKTPDKARNIDRFARYYLPEMVKLMGAYAELEKQGVKGDNADQIEADLRRNADTTAAAFENLLDALYSAEAMDISTDIEVLDSILKSQNLTK